VCKSKQASWADIQTFSSLPDVKETKGERRRRKKFFAACLLATHKHTTGNSVHCVEKNIGQATAAVDSIFPSLLLPVRVRVCTSNKAHERIGENRWKRNDVVVTVVCQIGKNISIASFYLLD
jgi:hypothetical protein